MKNAYKILVGRLEGGGNLGDLRVDGRTVLKCNVQE
jgi:hypothetical protein